MVTIYDIAKKTGFSPPTISKALNGTGDLRALTRALIVKTAGEMGYTPNVAARTLSTNRSNLIGVSDFQKSGWG
jgi:LacI family transcriptional regulator